MFKIHAYMHAYIYMCIYIYIDIDMSTHVCIQYFQQYDDDDDDDDDADDDDDDIVYDCCGSLAGGSWVSVVLHLPSCTATTLGQLACISGPVVTNGSGKDTLNPKP